MSEKGILIHFGLYSSLGGKYQGKKSGDYAEWIQSYLRISNKEMEQIAKNWKPYQYNAENIVKFVKNCGFSFIIFTAKHHEGFAMYHSKVDKYNIYDYGLKRDFLKELSIACQKYDIKLGIYYSQDLDWHEKNGGGYLSFPDDCAGSSWCNDWDYMNNEKNFDEYFYKKSLPQIEELFSEYGEISFAWFDTPKTLSKKQSKEIYDLVKKLQPKCMVNSRLGGGYYDYVSLGDNELPNSKDEFQKPNSLPNEINGIKNSPSGIYECLFTLNESWGYKSNSHWKNYEEIKKIVKKCEELDVNILLNIGLNKLGNIPKNAILILKNIKNI